MIIRIECDCEDNVEINIENKKYAQMKDLLWEKGFIWEKNEKNPDSCILRHKCGHYIYLGFD